MNKVDASNKLQEARGANTSLMSTDELVSHYLYRANLRAFLRCRRGFCLVHDTQDGTPRLLKDITESDLHNFKIEF